LSLSISPEKPNTYNRDRFLLSKGHGAPALFQVLAEKGFFPKSLLNEFGNQGSVFHEHPPIPGYIPGIEAATGSLGHGLPMAVGMSLGARIKNITFNSYVLISDGECNEGTVWEAAMFASSQRINNLIVMVDYNKWQATGRSNEILALEPLADKWKAFGWHVQEIDGHDFISMGLAFESSLKDANKPSVIICNTVKGKGVSFMEDDNNWHYRIPNDQEVKMAKKELAI